MSQNMASQTNHVDVLIVGAGISGIGTAYHLQKQCPDRTYAIVEGRADLGGTWDLFRYPGVRSDSDMHTLGFSFKPWKEAKSIADGPSILKYVRETAQENGIDKNIRFHHQVKTASWSSETATWTVTVVRQDTNETLLYTCNFLSMCAGYYSYKEGYTPEFAGRDSFKGQIVHPQKWPKFNRVTVGPHMRLPTIKRHSLVGQKLNHLEVLSEDLHFIIDCGLDICWRVAIIANHHNMHPRGIESHRLTPHHNGIDHSRQRKFKTKVGCKWGPKVVAHQAVLDQRMCASFN